MQSIMGSVDTHGLDQYDHDDLGFETHARSSRKLRKYRKYLSIITLMVITTTSSVLAYWLYEDLIYFFRSTTPTDLGNAEDLDRQNLEHNSHVRIEGIARDMCIRADRFWRSVKYLYLLGSRTGARTIVETPGNKDEPCLGALESIFEGRLTRIDQPGKYKHVVQYYRAQFAKAPVTGAIYMLEDGKRPRTYWKIPVLFLVLLAVWIVNIRTIWRLWN